MAVALMLGSLTVSFAGSSHPLPLTEEACSGTAPASTDCSTGSHPYWGVASSLTCGFEAGYVGTVASAMVYATGFRAITCMRHADGTLEGGQFGDGPDPDLLSSVTHLCESLDAGTMTPGGSGFWTCGITH